MVSASICSATYIRYITQIDASINLICAGANTRRNKGWSIKRFVLKWWYPFSKSLRNATHILKLINDVSIGPRSTENVRSLSNFAIIVLYLRRLDVSEVIVLQSAFLLAHLDIIVCSDLQTSFTLFPKSFDQLLGTNTSLSKKRQLDSNPQSFDHN